MKWGERQGVTLTSAVAWQPLIRCSQHFKSFFALQKPHLKLRALSATSALTGSDRSELWTAFTDIRYTV